MKHPQPQGLPNGIQQREPDGQNHSADPLHQKRPCQHQPHQLHNAFQLTQCHGLLDHQPLPDADSPPKQEVEHRHKRHIAKAANLDQPQQHRLPKHRPLAVGIHQ